MAQLRMLYSYWLDQDIAPPTIFSLASWPIHCSILVPSYLDHINTRILPQTKLL